jgi:hypothetical protein
MHVAQQFLSKFSTTKFHKNPLTIFQAVSCMLKNGWAARTNLTEAPKACEQMSLKMLRLLSVIQPPASFGHV